MTRITRGELVLAGLGLPGLAVSAHAVVPLNANEQRAKRFEETGGYELAGVVSQHPLAILPLGSLEFHGPHNPVGMEAIISADGIVKLIENWLNNEQAPGRW